MFPLLFTMIDISNKDTILRIGKASGMITLKEDTISRIKNQEVEKGDVFSVAKISAINAVKKVPELIPFCHPIPITKVNVEFEYVGENTIKAECEVKSIGKTGVEMEALTGVSSALLNIRNVVKMYEKDSNGQ